MKMDPNISVKETGPIMVSNNEIDLVVDLAVLVDY